MLRKAPRTDKNFKATNAAAVIHAPVRVITPPTGKKADYGKVPAYILARKEEMQKEVEQRKLEEANRDIPPGMIRMSEEDRLKTLALLA